MCIFMGVKEDGRGVVGDEAKHHGEACKTMIFQWKSI